MTEQQPRSQLSSTAGIVSFLFKGGLWIAGIKVLILIDTTTGPLLVNYINRAMSGSGY